MPVKAFTKLLFRNIFAIPQIKGSNPIQCLVYRLWGEAVNLREHHGALDFFNSLVESLDKALKALGHPSMGGSFADQKICQGCPYR